MADRNKVSFDKRIRENIRKYGTSQLLEEDRVRALFDAMAPVTGTELLLTDRDGNKVVCTKGYPDCIPDVEKEPGRKVRIEDRTIAHLYAVAAHGEEEPTAEENELFDQIAGLLAEMGRQTYLYKESSIYVDELERTIAEGERRRVQREKMDPLTGTYNRPYFEKRMEIVERSAVIPVAVVYVNINDWKFANDHFGDEGSDRLIRLVGGYLLEEAKPEYIVGRIDGDTFVVLIPVAEDGEGEEYAARVQDRCWNCDDPQLAPAVACGVVYRTNVEESFVSLLSDAEYEMLSNKLEIKEAPGYYERMESKL